MHKPPQTFTDKIYATVARIPRGKVASYGLIALLAGKPRAARAVGMAMRDVPQHLQLPCHRVIRSDGTLACKRIFAGRQHAMLQRERITFLPNGKVNMPRHEWNPAPPKKIKRLS
jgi:methylated-DNA-protein-cysteine methyltransferase-like protein